MKKLISLVACSALVFSAVPLSVSAETIPAYTEIVSGDLNNDGAVSVADMVTMSRYILGTEQLDPQQYANTDINNDGEVNAFDLVYMRKVISKEIEPARRNYIFSTLHSCDSFHVYESEGIQFLFTDSQQLESYLSEILTDKDEISAFMQTYNDEFFTENAVFLQPVFIKDFDNQDYKTVLKTFFSTSKKAFITEYVNIFDTSQTYNVTGGKNVLAQVAIPKEEAEQYIGEGKFSFWTSDDYLFQQTKAFSSDDGSVSLYAVSDIVLFEAETGLYLKQSDNTYKFVADMGDVSINKIEPLFNQDCTEITYKVRDTEITKTLTIDLQGNVISRKATDASGNPADFDTNALIFSSPDGDRSVYITQSAFLLNSNVDLYMKDQNGELKEIFGFATDDGHTPFSSNGEWSEDENGYPVFADKNEFSITWKPESIIIDHRLEYSSDCWEYVEVSDSGEVLQNYTYTKELDSSRFIIS